MVIETPASQMSGSGEIDAGFLMEDDGLRASALI
jgi:hypothetical protein